MAQTKERQSRMAVSSLHQQPAKSGAGGYNWGSAMDVKDYEPVGVQMNTVTVAPSPVAARVISPTAAQPVGFSIQDSSAFPSLGAPAAGPAVARSWGPTAATVISTTAPAAMTTASPVSSVKLNQGALRPGALDVVDSQHPRNLFAKKAYVKNATEVAVQQPAVIDWSKSGMPPEVMQQVLKAANPAHLGPYAGKPAEPIPLDVLRGRAAFEAKAQFTRLPAQQANYAPKPVIVQQPRKL